MENIDLKQKLALLRKQSVFSQLSDKENEELASLLKEKHFEAGETVVNEGELVDSVYLIVQGKADVRHIRIQDGQPVITSVAKLKENDAIGLNESGFYSISGVRTASVIAETHLVLLFLSVASFHGFALMHQHVNEIMRRNAQKILLSD
ncbi:MAG: cyclic nucleotide-binding domain-containing protein [Gammaproteobacteria bacterium]|nr:cyclic nucleotide-binding domain-containing protein [Gammaproteobacteria bacterium]